MRAVIKAILERLLASDAREISLDEVGAAIGSVLVTQPEIEELLDALEEAGRRVSGAPVDLPGHLRRVLVAARRLRSQAHREPSIDAIVEATGLSENEVRAALLYASVLAK